MHSKLAADAIVASISTRATREERALVARLQPIALLRLAGLCLLRVAEMTAKESK
jgi:hypothetical protein